MKFRIFQVLLLKQTSAFNNKLLYIPEGNRHNRSSIFKYIAGSLLASIAIISCNNGGGSVNPQILTFNYVVRATTDRLALVDRIQNGQQTISGLLGSNPCNFTADFSTPTPPEVAVNGTPGQMGFNVHISSSAPANINSTNSSSCSPLKQIVINIGSSSETLTLGTQTSVLEGTITLDSGKLFNIKDFFQATVSTFDPATGRTSGDFRFISGLSRYPDSLLIVEGSFALKP